jgi:hypothetical protein
MMKWDLILIWGVMTMTAKKKNKPKTWAEVFQAQRREFPQGYCVTRAIPDKRFKKPKHKGKEWE